MLVGKVSFDDLNSTEFEAFCVDLLKCVGFVNVEWRKGTPLDASPADQGRDIEAVLERTDVDGYCHYERWSVDAKHYLTRGVPPEAINVPTHWGWTRQIDVLLIIASGFLSNPTKTWIKDLIDSRKPPFRIRVWEHPTLQSFVERFPHLMDRHNVAAEPVRPRAEVAQARREYEDIVWYERIQRSLDWVGDPTTEVTALTLQRLASIEQLYDRTRLYPWSDRTRDFNRGRLSALRWAMGEEWDYTEGDDDELDEDDSDELD